MPAITIRRELLIIMTIHKELSEGVTDCSAEELLGFLASH